MSPIEISVQLDRFSQKLAELDQTFESLPADMQEAYARELHDLEERISLLWAQDEQSLYARREDIDSAYGVLEETISTLVASRQHATI